MTVKDLFLGLVESGFNLDDEINVNVTIENNEFDGEEVNAKVDKYDDGTIYCSIDTRDVTENMPKDALRNILWDRVESDLQYLRKERY